jgi:ADP-ribose pyrophosphatase YjhB (NUDIX family)
MLGIHRLIMQKDLNHAGGPAHWYETRLSVPVRLARTLIYGYRNTRRRLFRHAPFIPPPFWKVSAFTMIREQAGQVLWVKRQEQDVWTLPGGLRAGREAPWATAIRTAFLETGMQIRLVALSAVHTFPARGEAALFFAADIAGGALRRPGEGAEIGYYAPGEEPSQALTCHVIHTGNLRQGPDVTLFHKQADEAGGV